MPRITNIGIGIQGATSFKTLLLQYLKRTKNDNLQLTLPLIGAHRVPRKNLDDVAVECDIEFAREIAKMSDAFLATHPGGIFQAYRSRQPPHVNVSRRINPSRRRTRRSTPPQSATGEGVGTMFEVDGTTYCLFRMYETVAHEGGNCMACAYVRLSPPPPFHRSKDIFPLSNDCWDYHKNSRPQMHSRICVTGPSLLGIST